MTLAGVVRRLASRRLGLVILALSLVALGLTACLPPPPGTPTMIVTDPPLFPAFQTRITNYVIRCDPNTPTAVHVTSPTGTLVSVDGHPARSGVFGELVPEQCGQRFTIAVTTPDATVYNVRCLPPDFPPWTAQPAPYGLTPFFQTTPISPATRRTPRSTTATAYRCGGTGRRTRSSRPCSPRERGVPGQRGCRRVRPRRHVRPQREDGGRSGRRPRCPRPAERARRDGHDRAADRCRPHGARRSGERLDLRPRGPGDRPERRFTGVELGHLRPRTGHRDGPTVVAGVHLRRRVDPGVRLRRVPLERHRADGERLHPLVPAPGRGVRDRPGQREHRVEARRLDPAREPHGRRRPGVHRREPLRRPARQPSPTRRHGHALRRWLEPRPRARAVRYSIDTTARTATLLDSVGDPEVTGSFCCGSARYLGSKVWVIGWGGTNVGTESVGGIRQYTLTFPGSLMYRAIPLTTSQVNAKLLTDAMDAQFTNPAVVAQAVPPGGVTPFPP